MKFRSNENDTAASTFPFLFFPLLSIRLSCPFFTDFLSGPLNWKGTSFGKLFNSRRGSRIDTDRFPTER